MHAKSHCKSHPLRASPPARAALAVEPRRAAPWQPEPTGLTREELRRIVIDIIG